MALEMPASAPGRRHPNRVPFKGVLTLVEKASDRPPAGARGKRVVLTRAAAERALATLLGMGVDHTPAMDGHDARRKVGIITSADVVGNELVVSGYIFGRDFPDVVREIKGAAGRLGMSFEVADAKVEDVNAAIWRLTEVTFTGAALLRKDKAAYRNTWVELQAGVQAEILGRMRVSEELAQVISGAERIAAAAEALEKALQRQASLEEKVERIVAAVEESRAAAALHERVAELEKQNAELKAQAGRAMRKTLPPIVTSLLAKHEGESLDSAVLDKALAGLSVEQRIAVKAQMARVGILE